MTAKDTAAKILALHAEGIAPAAIAQKLNLTPSTVYRALRAAKVEREHTAVADGRRMRAEMAPSVRELAEKGYSATQICQKLNMGHDTLKKTAEEHGIPLKASKPGRPSAKDQHWPQIIEMLEQGYSQTEIAQKLGLKLPSLGRWIREEQVEYTRIDRTDHTANLGKTPEERAQNGAAGGKAAAEGLIEVHCLYPGCDKLVARGREGSNRMTRDRYCSQKHFFDARREGSGKTKTYVCQYEKCEDPEFTWWTNQPRKYCCQDHFHRANRNVPNYGFNGRIIHGGYEAAFIGLCSVHGIQFDFFDRSECIEKPTYGPDFKLDVGGKIIYVDTKGAEQKAEKWARFRAERGPLVILRKEGLQSLMAAPGRKEVLSALKVMAIEQEHA